MSKNIWLSTSEAAEYLGLSPPTLIRYRREGIGPSWYRVGRRNIRYRQSDLDSWLTDRREKNRD